MRPAEPAPPPYPPPLAGEGRVGANDNRSRDASRSLLTPGVFSGIQPQPRRAPPLRLQPIRIVSPTTSQSAKQCGDCGGYMIVGGMNPPPQSIRDRIHRHGLVAD